MIEYNAALIEEFAARLYAQANFLLIKYIGGGLLLGLGLGGWGAVTTEQPLALLLAPALAVVGYFYARDRAFMLKLKAQVALCQVQIEKNTRSALA